jgi:hypothetical protein
MTITDEIANLIFPVLLELMQSENSSEKPKK